ncbi:MAG: hypothetical protein FWE98_02205 [Oscillospiraceae bacterium]|nr:hypothetical protein [Oscillospiraceae bacterium]
MKHFTGLFAILLLATVLAVPAFAETTAPDGVQTIGEPGDDLYTEDADMTAAPGFSIEPRFGEDPTEEQTYIAFMPYNEETTLGIVPINGELLMGQEEDGGVLSQRGMSLIALCFSAVALAFSAIALLRTRKKTAPGVTGNYQKYF